MIVSCFTIILLRKKEVITFCLLLSCFIGVCTVTLPLGADSLYVICDCGISLVKLICCLLFFLFDLTFCPPTCDKHEINNSYTGTWR